MSSVITELSNRVLGQLSDDIIDHMKRLGDYDEIRVKLIEPIMTDVDFDKIKEKFLNECEQFCEKADLNLNRNALRMKLADHFSSSSRNSSEYMVKAHILEMLGKRDEELRSEYYEKARTFLIKKYSQEPISSPEIQNEMILDTDLGSQQVVDMEIEDSPERPTYSPIGDDDDELEKLSFSSVSTVHTADLSDFDNSIKLSDDEANIVGRPKNSKVSVDDIKNRIYDLAPIKVECKQELPEPPEVVDHADAIESDGACAESNSGKRATRARKVNPRYSNEDFTHTPYKR